MRTLFPTLRALLASCVVLAAISVAEAEAPFAKTPAPGWYRMQLGDFEVTALADGTLELPVATMFPQVKPERIRALLARSFLAGDVQTSVNAFLVNTKTKLVLIDTGTGTAQMFGPKLGQLLANLRAAGYAPEQVDEIYVTHMHTDHAGGLILDGKATFPNAIVRAHSSEAGHYLNKAMMEASPDDREDFESAMASFAPYAAAGRFKPFENATELVPGVRALPALGHTPGHTAYVVESKGQKMVIWGDIMHVAAVQFAQPSATVQFDWDGRKSSQQRSLIFADVAKHGYFVGAAHVAFPGIGKLRADGGGYAWVPISYIAGH